MAGMVHEIVAGYDGSPGSAGALDWAVWEARARGVMLTVCYAWAPGADGPPGDGAAAEAARLHGEQVLAGGLRRAQTGIGAGEVRPLLAAGPPARVLCERGQGATMVVVGSRGRGGLAGLPLGSVSLQVAGHARGPVTVVRGHIRRVRGHWPGPVAVGTDGSEVSRAATAFAIEEAALRGVPLLAVCALADSARGARRRPACRGGLRGDAGQVRGGSPGGDGAPCRRPGRSARRAARGRVAGPAPGAGRAWPGRAAGNGARIGQPRDPALRPLPRQRHPSAIAAVRRPVIGGRRTR
jgi:nucleotide-binding universal stress UspA family protein